MHDSCNEQLLKMPEFNSFFVCVNFKKKDFQNEYICLFLN